MLQMACTRPFAWTSTPRPVRLRRHIESCRCNTTPTKNQGSAEAKAQFDAVRDAYEILSDRKKRSVYDTGGVEAVKQAVQKKQQGGDRDIFGRKRQRRPAMQLEVKVSLRDMYVGNEFKHTIKRTAICRGCKKSNKKKCRKCGRCPDEIKMVTRQMAPGFNVQQQTRVKSEEKCMKENHELVAAIEKGMADGSEIWFEGQADEKPGQEPGDILMKIVQSKDHRLTRDGDDLHFTQKINLKEALLGFNKTFVHLDGHEVNIASDKIVKPFEVMKIKGEGMPKHNFPTEFGDLHVKFDIIFPKSMPKGARNCVAAW